VSQETSNRTFDDLARALAEGSISRRGALKLFAGSAIAALIPSRALAQQQKVTICHKPGTPDEQTKEVPKSAVNGHLGHGDQLGPCCQPNGGSCSTSGECCSGRCLMTGGGFCVPPEGSNLLECDCLDDSFLNLCSAACGSDAHPVCVAFCAPHGGLEAEQCAPNPGCGAS
jgi:hypothetical protein